MIKKYICPICKKPYTELNSTISHIDNTHEDLTTILKEKDITIKQYLFNIRNKKEPFTKFGKSIITGKPTTFNESVGKYNRINPNEKALYREYRNKNMMKVRGTINMLTDPEHQKVMLANRSISGKYLYGGKTEVNYTGSYELHFLEYLDELLNWDINDLEIPAKEVLYYKDPETGKDRFYIPDLYIISLNLLIEIKPTEEQFHYRLRDNKVEIEKDKAVFSSGINFIKIFDKDYTDFMLKVKELSENLEN